MKPDIIISWPRHVDYPLWRQFIRDNRNRLSKVIIVFTNMNTDGDYRQFVQDAMARDDIIAVDNGPVLADQDWRSVAVNKALQYSDNEWVWFTEQDFSIKEGFWEEIERNVNMHYDAFGACIGTRLHPCCIFAKRKLIDSTSKNFGVIPDKSDHFGIFQSEITNYTHIDPKTYGHMNGLSQNMWMLQHGEEPNYEPGNFKDYLRECLECTVPIDPKFITMAEEYLK